MSKESSLVGNSLDSNTYTLIHLTNNNSNNSFTVRNSIHIVDQNDSSTKKKINVYDDVPKNFNFAVRGE